MKLIVGLGNPGAKYARNRHNIGFLAVDRIHVDHGGGPWRKKFQADVSEATVERQRCLLVKPTTFMNESGRAVTAAAQFYKTPVSDIIVLHDELDLAPGKVRAKVGGGHAGHNGLRSIQAQCGADFVRLRLGIGHPGHKDKVHSWVLGDFAKADADWLDDLVRAMSREMPLILAGELDQAMSRVGQAVTPPGPAAKAPGQSPSRNASTKAAKPAPAKQTPRGPGNHQDDKAAGQIPDRNLHQITDTNSDTKSDQTADQNSAPSGGGPLAAALRGLLGGSKPKP